MLSFTINNQPLLLDEDTSVRITIFNPACYTDKIEGDVGMGISIPENDNNRALLGNPGRFERDVTTADNEFPGFEVRYSGMLLMAGTLVIQGYSNKTYSGWLRSNVGNLGKEHREKFIYDIPAFDQPVTFTNKADYDPETDPYGCPTIFNPNFFKDKGRKIKVDTQVPNPDYYIGSGLPPFVVEKMETEALTEGFRIGGMYFINKLKPGGTVTTDISTGYITDPSLKIYVVTPMLFLNYVIKSILADANFYIDENAIAEHDDLKKLVVYNNFDITNIDYVVYDYDKIIFTSPTSGRKISFSATIEQITRHYNGTFKFRDLLPKTKLKDFLIGIQNLANVCFHFLPNGKVNIIDKEAIITGAAIDIDKYMVGDWEIGEKKDVTLKFKFTHDDDDTYFSEEWEDVDDRREDEKEPVDTVADLEGIENPEIGEMRYVREENSYWQYTWLEQKEPDPATGGELMTDALGWEHVATNFQNGFFNTKKEEVEEIETVFGTLYGESRGMAYQKGNIQSMKMAYESFSPRLIFYTGNNTGSFKTDTLALDWELDGIGLIAKRWPQWARFWSQRKPVMREAHLPLNVLDYMSRNITSKFRTRNGEFIIETLETEFRINGFGPSKITGYKSGYTPNQYDLAQHWAPGNLVLMDEIIDFSGFDNINFGIDFNFDLWP